MCTKVCLLYLLSINTHVITNIDTTSTPIGRIKMEQTISFTGLATDHANAQEALAQIWTCIRASAVATAAEAKNDAFQTALDAGDVTVEHDFDAAAGTLTITRTWGDDAWATFNDISVDMSAITDMLEANGITATGL